MGESLLLLCGTVRRSKIGATILPQCVCRKGGADGVMRCDIMIMLMTSHCALEVKLH